jgi:hypothetical protein
MKRIVFFGLFLAISSSSFAQNISVKYSKGSSILNFDVETRSLLASDIGLVYSKNKNAFEVGFIRQELVSDASINNASDIFLNFESKLESNYLSFYRHIGVIDNFKFNLGLTAGLTNYEIYTNLENNLGQQYQDYDFETWEELGYSSENDFETNLSELNVDGLNDYPLSYFYFGPLLECEIELVENFDLTIKSIYKKNLTDLLDNVNVNNLRDVPATNQTDNQLDLFVGVRFNLSKNRNSVNDSLVEVIDSLNTEDVIKTPIESADNSSVTEQSIPQNNSEKILSREEYILQFFDSSNIEDESSYYLYTQEELTEDSFEEGKKYPYVSSEFVEKVIDEENSFTQADSEDYSSYEATEEEIVSEDVYYEEPFIEETVEEVVTEEVFNEEEIVVEEEVIEESFAQEEAVEESMAEEEKLLSYDEYYLIVGVFAFPENLKSYAETLQISPENTFKKNDLNYLYIFKTNNLFEARLLRESLEVENWIYYTNQ